MIVAKTIVLILEISVLGLTTCKAVPVQQTTGKSTVHVKHGTHYANKEVNKLENELVDAAKSSGGDHDPQDNVNKSVMDNEKNPLRKTHITVVPDKLNSRITNDMFRTHHGHKDNMKDDRQRFHGTGTDSRDSTNQKQEKQEEYTVDMIVSMVKSLRQNPKLLLLVIQDILANSENSEKEEGPPVTKETEKHQYRDDSNENVYRELNKLQKRPPAKSNDHQETLKKKGSIPPKPVLRARDSQQHIGEPLKDTDIVDLERINGQQFVTTKHPDLEDRHPSNMLQIMDPDNEDNIFQNKEHGINPNHENQNNEQTNHKTVSHQLKLKEIKHDMESNKKQDDRFVEKHEDDSNTNGDDKITQKELFKEIPKHDKHKTKTNHETLADELRELSSHPKEHLHRERKNGHASIM